MDLDAKLRLHPTTVLTAGGEGRVYIKMPDGEGLSFQSSSLPIMSMLTSLQTVAQSARELLGSDLLSGFRDQATRLLKVLTDRQILVYERDYSGSDDLDGYFDYVARSASRSEVFQAEKHARTRFRILGEGFVADNCRRVLGSMGRLDEQHDDSAIRVVCADRENFEYFSDINEELVGKGATALYVWMSGAKFCFGPLVVPHDSPCFHCMENRMESNVHFIDEFRATVRGEREVPKEIADESGCLGGLLSYLLRRHFSLIANDVTGLVAAGNIYEFNLITASLESHPVVKLPRCGVCGRAREDHLQRAVRDLL